MEQKIDSVHTELQDTNRRLEIIEWQSLDAKTALESIQSDINNIASQTSIFKLEDSSNKIEEKLDDVITGTKLIITTLRMLSSDVKHVKSNISRISNETNFPPLSDEIGSRDVLNSWFSKLAHAQTCAPSHEKNHLVSCADVRNTGYNASGIYEIKPRFSGISFMVQCDLETEGGGWTVIQNRYEGSQDFYRNFDEYKYGFGNLAGEFWLGLDNIYLLTGKQFKTDIFLKVIFAFFSLFSLEKKKKKENVR